MPHAVAALRAALLVNGFAPVPVRTGDKRPAETGWPDRARALLLPGAAALTATPDALNTGILCDGLRPLDIDVDDAATAASVLALAANMLGDTLSRVRANSPRSLLLYRAAAGSPGKRSIAGPGGKVEILGTGQQFVAFGLHTSGAALEWEPIGPDEVRRDRLPGVTEEQIGAFLAAAAPLIGAHAHDVAGAAGAGRQHDAADLAPPSAAAVIDLLGRMPNPLSVDRDQYVAVMLGAVGCIEGLAAVGRLADGDEAAIAGAAIAWAARWEGPGFGAAYEAEKWETDWRHRKSPLAGWQSLQRAAAKLIPDYRVIVPPESFSGVQIDPPPPPPPIPAATPLEELARQGRLPSETELAARFVEAHAGRLRYLAAQGEWREWTGQVWCNDATLRAMDLAREVCEQAATECSNRVQARQLESARTIAAVERIARAHRMLATTAGGWDADPWLLNTPAGVVDLRTGETQPHDPALRMTKMTAVGPGAGCPRWLAFLDRITGGDTSMQAFFQRVAGYCLTGSTREHALFFLYGTGANGKSTFVSTLNAVLSDYAVVADAATFTASLGEQHPTSLAMLAGARLVSVQETEQGRAWAEARIKAVTGGDPITARFMHRDNFTFAPAFKLLVAGNHKPELHAVDEAMRRRLHLLPFNVTIPVAERDPDLPEKLRAEWPGILAWAITGCLAWQRDGLTPPAAVRGATDEYVTEEDSIADWISECCVVGAGEFVRSASLFASWCGWCAEQKQAPGTAKAFSRALIAHGFRKHREGGTGNKGFAGITLRSFFAPAEIPEAMPQG